MNKHMALKPRSTEKTYALSHTLNTFVFDVPLSANKLQVAKAVEEQFEVKVAKVRVVVVKGKQARSIRIGSRARANVSGKRNDNKKAYVTLAEGQTLPIFAAVDEQIAKQEKVQEQADKAAKKAEKKAKKEDK